MCHALRSVRACAKKCSASPATRPSFSWKTSSRRAIGDTLAAESDAATRASIPKRARMEIEPGMGRVSRIENPVRRGRSIDGKCPNRAAIAINKPERQRRKEHTILRELIQIGQAFHNRDSAAEQDFVDERDLGEIVDVGHGGRLDTQQFNLSAHAPTREFLTDAGKPVTVNFGIF